jgi:hypothetical protein
MYKFVVSRGEMPTTIVEFRNITDAVAYIIGSERLNPDYSIEYVIKKVEIKEKEK